MRVAWLCPHPVLSLPGVPLGRRPAAEHPSTWIVTLSRALRRHEPGIELHLVTETPWVTRDCTVEQDGIPIHIVRSGGTPPGLCRGWPAAFPLDLWTGFRANVHALLRRVDAIAPDVVHAHGTERAYGLAALACSRPALLSLQGILNEIHRDKPGWRWARLRALELECVRGLDCFVAKTPFARAFIERHHPGATIFDLENPVAPAHHAAEAKPGAGRRLVFVGSLVPEKGLAELIDALAGVSGATLRVIGTGEPAYAAELIARAAGLGVGDRIRWLGQQPQAVVVAELAASDLLVLPSHMETSPNVVAEAMAAGLPALACAVGGVPAMVADGITGRLVPPRDAPALAAALAALLGDPDGLARMGAAARAEARRRFLPEAAAARLASAYAVVRQRPR